MPGIRTRSHWDNVPSETLINICAFLTTLDLLNMCSAYPIFEPLLLNSASLWKYVHLPFPDPMLFNYPGWRKESHAQIVRARQYSTDSSSSPISISSFSSSSTSSSALSSAASSSESPFFELHSTKTDATEHGARQASRRGSRMTVLCDDRLRFLSEPEYYNLPDIDGGENDEQEENTAWVILDVLDRVPLRFVQHLSFETPPCHLCTYPCSQTCYCECHQNEQSRPLYYQGARPRDHTEGQSPDHLTGQQSDHPGLSRPLQDLFESGLVDFSQHIDLHSLNRALAFTTENGANGAVRGMGGGTGLGTQQHPPVEYHPPLTFHNTALEEYNPLLAVTPSQSHGLNQLDLHEALLQLSLVDEQSHERGFDRVSSPREEEDIALTEEEDLEITRQQAETRAAYQRARLLIRILSSGQLEALETLRVPWWPATRIYTIRQQLERWSYMIEQAASNCAPPSNLEGQGVYWRYWGQQAAPASTLASPRMGIADFHHSIAPWSSRWTNGISSERTGHISGDDRVETSLPEIQPHPRSPGITRFPLASLTRFSLRSGGDIVSHERHCLGTSALILSGRSSTVYPSSIASSTPSTPPMHQSTSSPSSIPVAHSDLSASTSTPNSPVSVPCSPSASYPSSSASGSPSDPETSYLIDRLGELSKPTFRYCQHCGSQYLASLKASRESSTNSDRRSDQHQQTVACFCQVSC